MKNTKTTYTPVNLLNSEPFISALKFEAEYANAVKGGYLPALIDNPKRKRLVNDINLINTGESLHLITNLFISQN